MHKTRRIVLVCIPAALLTCAAVLGLLFYFGVLQCNNPSTETYPVRGVDVSSYQGEIDWPVLAAQDIRFAFIKATEGSSAVDPCFTRNLAGALKTDLRIGAYHFFSYDSPGETQADNFIAAVPVWDGMLPPVVDVEFYGDKEKNPPDKAAVQAELTDLLARLEAHYGLKPILYATEKSYALYIDGALDAYDLWIRSVFRSPRLPENRRWTFWQYSNRKRLAGYSGRESYIDMNLFYGSPEQFEQYAGTSA